MCQSKSEKKKLIHWETVVEKAARLVIHLGLELIQNENRKEISKKLNI